MVNIVAYYEVHVDRVHLRIKNNEISNDLLFLNVIENHVFETLEVVKQIIMLFQCIVDLI